MEPKLLLLDEPLSNLDARLREAMRIELRSLQKRLNITTLYVTHDQAEAFSLSDEIKIVMDGKIVGEGSPQELYYEPCTDTAAEFLGCTNRMSARLIAFKREDGLTSVETPIGEILCYVPKSLKEGETFNLYIRPSNITIYDKKPSNAVNVLRDKVLRSTCLGSDHIEHHMVVNDQVLRARGRLLRIFDDSKEIFLAISPEGNVIT